MKITLLASLVLTAIATAGCGNAFHTSTGEKAYQNPPAQDPKVAVDPSKPNSPANTVEATARASMIATTAAPGPVPEPATPSTPSNLSKKSPAVVTSSPSGLAVPIDPAKSGPADRSASPDRASSDLGARIMEWHLDAAEIQKDLERGATIVRSRASAAGAPTGKSDDAALTTMVKDRIQSDADIRTTGITVQARDGEITLTGTTDGSSQIGRAIALALDTPGVTKVSSDLKVLAPAGK